MADDARQIDVLFVSERPLWPVDQGYRIRGSNMAQALRDLGARVAVACMTPNPHDAPQSLHDLCLPWPEADEEARRLLRLAYRGPLAPLRRRLARYLAPPRDQLAGVVQLAIDHQPQVVIALGQHGPILLRSLRKLDGITTLWYAADELIRFHLSCLWKDPLPKVPARIRSLTVHALLELCFARRLSGSIGVSPSDTAALQRFATPRSAITIRNGVDLDFFSPPAEQPHERSIIFWGRMDFEPNIEAVCWFARYVWPRIQKRSPGAEWRIAGKSPVQRVKDLQKLRGVKVLGAVPDIREAARQAAVTILPMRSGGGIKNKLLEAAAMGRPIVASPRAVDGLNLPDPTPLTLCDTPNAWAWSIVKLWSDHHRAQALGRSARQWVERQHSWQGAASRLIQYLDVLNGNHTADRQWLREAGNPYTLPEPVEQLLQRVFDSRRERGTGRDRTGRKKTDSARKEAA